MATFTVPDFRNTALDCIKPATPKAAYEKATDLGALKASYDAKTTLMLGIASGSHIGLGALLAIAGGGSASAMNPGAQRLLMGSFGLPMGLFMTLVGGVSNDANRCTPLVFTAC